MNLLIVVLSLIMVLSAISYARLESFLKSRFHAKEWSWIAHESERDRFNHAQLICNAKSQENKAPAPSTPPPKKDDKTPAPSPGVGQISLSWLFKKDFREKHKAAFPKVEELFVKLLTDAWGNQPFFIQLQEERPEFLKGILEEILILSEKANVKDSKLKVTHLDDLIYLPWNDLTLKTAFARMLQEGLIFKGSDRQNSQDLETMSSPTGYQSLNDYFSAREADKIRVWLAPRPILKALFPDSWQEVIKTREALWRELKKENGPSADELSTRFEQTFSEKTPYPELVDFKVTKTNILDR